MKWKDSEKKSEKIARILKKVCPAFYREKDTGGSCWHHCYCQAQNPDKSGALQPCTCVWHITDHCIAGVWPQLSFISEEHKIDCERSLDWLREAEEAIRKTEIG